MSNRSRPGVDNRSDKPCSGCGEFKAISEYNICRYRKDGLPTYYAACRDCRSSWAYIHMRSLTFQRQYGITLEQYEEMNNRQNGLCAVCGQPETRIQRGKVYLLCVDHDHITGKVRGLLCNNCNRAIGLLKDDVDVLKNALYYIENGGESDFE